MRDGTRWRIGREKMGEERVGKSGGSGSVGRRGWPRELRSGLAGWAKGP